MIRVLGDPDYGSSLRRRGDRKQHGGVYGSVLGAAHLAPLRFFCDRGIHATDHRDCIQCDHPFGGAEP